MPPSSQDNNTCNAGCTGNHSPPRPQDEIIEACADSSNQSCRRTPPSSVIPISYDETPENIGIIADTLAEHQHQNIVLGSNISPSDETSLLARYPSHLTGCFSLKEDGGNEEKKAGVATATAVPRRTRRSRKRPTFLPSPRQSELHLFAFSDDILKLVVLEEGTSEC